MCAKAAEQLKAVPMRNPICMKKQTICGMMSSVRTAVRFWTQKNIHGATKAKTAKTVIPVCIAKQKNLTI